MATQILSASSVGGRCVLVGLAVVLAAAMRAEPAQAQTPSPAAPGSTSSGSYSNPQPYLAVPPFYVNLQPRPRAEARPLFQTRVRPGPGAAVSAARPRVVCGMTVVPGNPAVDPGITARMTPPEERPAIRAVVPSVCGETRQP